VKRVIGVHGIKIFVDREKYHFPIRITGTGTKKRKRYVKKRENARGTGFFGP
jgi:hypothetical protein